MTGALHFTSREKLNIELVWENFKSRIDFLGLIIFYKIHLQDTRPLVRSCLTKLDNEKTHYTRSKGGYSPDPNYGAKYQKTFFPYVSKM